MNLNTHFEVLVAVGIVCFLGTSRATAQIRGFRPPAVPLLTFDPYFSVWSEADHLTDDVTRHWTHHPQPLTSLIQIDRTKYRLMGVNPKDVPALPQVSLQVTPSQSIYQYRNAQVAVQLSFMAPLMPDDLNALTRPVNYVEWKVRSMDGQKHLVSIFFGAGSALAVNVQTQKVEWARETMGSLTSLRVGTQDQPMLQNSGDDTRIDWGYAYVAATTKQSTEAVGSEDALIASFLANGELPRDDDPRMPRAVSDDTPTLGVCFDLGRVGPQEVDRHVLVAYDEVYSIKYFGQKLRPYWRRNGATPSSMLQEAERLFKYESDQCRIFDRLLQTDLVGVGGEKYAQIASIAYRQALAANGIAADGNKQPLLFTKENTSNGDIATVDVIFPMCPLLILFNPTLAKASIVPILSYAASDHWKFPNAPHDLGTYPIARGTDDGGEGMPVEESGNMLIMCDAIAQSEGNAKWLNPWWDKLTQWAAYLEKFGLDPEDQLCTDDFMGHLAHNANLSIKAILGLAAYGDLCRIRGDADARRLSTTSSPKPMAPTGFKLRTRVDTRLLAFDQPNTWSQKYNLVWDRILNLGVFPSSVARQEVEFYRTKLQPYGLPLDSRTHLTKSDWSVWSATLATDLDAFEAITDPLYDYLNTTTARSPLADSYMTDNIKSDGMHARSVVGGVFIKMLADRASWKKWIQTDDKDASGKWAPLPVMPKLTEVVPTSRVTSVVWRYSLAQPTEAWSQAAFDDSTWKQGSGPFGSNGTPGISPKTVWTSDDIWLRRELTMPAWPGDLQVLVYHDEDVEVYVNGVLAFKEAGYVNSYEPQDITAEAKAILKSGAKITVAVHCHQTVGGQGVDVGFVSSAKAPS